MHRHGCTRVLGGSMATSAPHGYIRAASLLLPCSIVLASPIHTSFARTLVVRAPWAASCSPSPRASSATRSPSTTNAAAICVARAGTTAPSSVASSALPSRSSSSRRVARSPTRLTPQRYKQQSSQGAAPPTGLGMDTSANEKDGFASLRQDVAASARPRGPTTLTAQALETAERTLEAVLQQVRSYKVCSP